MALQKPQKEYLVNMDKKAVSPEIMVVLLAFIIVAIILLTFSGQLTSLFKEDADIETCRLSVLAQSQTKLFGKSIVPLDCPRRNLKIFENKVEINGKKSKKYEFNKLTADEVNHIAAEEMRLCWYKMAEGNRNIFEQSYLFETKSNTCVICSEIQFDDKLKGQYFDGLLDYLKSKKIPKLDKTYFDYLIRSQSDFYLLFLPYGQYNPWFYGTTGKVSESKFDTNQKYLIYFLAFKPPWLAEKVGAITSAYYLGLGKEDKRNTECDIQIN